MLLNFSITRNLSGLQITIKQTIKIHILKFWVEWNPELRDIYKNEYTTITEKKLLHC